MVIDFNAIKTLYLANNEVEELYINGSKVWEKPASIFTVQARTSNVTIGSSAQGSPSQRSLEYSVDNGETWNTFTLGSTTVTLANAGDKMMLRGTNSTIANTWQNYWKLTFSDDVDVLGNLNSLLGGSEDTLTGSLYGLFDGQTHLIDASGLVMPWTTIASIAVSDCAALEAMFRNCSGLVSAPDLPATTAEGYCYKSMFQNCTSLATAPSLPATTVGEECYNGMFNGCTALTTPPPALPAIDLPRSCYQGMFNGCSSLTATPATLGATTMSGKDAMGGMFGNCTSLTSAFDINVAAPTIGAFYGTFYGCSSLTSVNICQMTSAPWNAFREMFYNCTSLTNAPDVFSSMTSVGQWAFSKTFYGCTSITQIPTLPSATGNGLANFCFEHMFEGCTGLTGTIDLTQFTDIQGTGNRYGAFDYAFVGCTGITKVDLSNLTTAHGIYHAFDGCTSLQELDLSNLETIRSDSQSVFENMCNGCTSLTTVYLNKLASMGSYNTQWHNAFNGCSSLQNIYMDETQTIPYFYNNDTFTNANADYKIYVTGWLYDQWILTSGWSEQGVVEHIIRATDANTKYGVAINNLVGDIDQNGYVQRVSSDEKFVFNAPEIRSVGSEQLRKTFQYNQTITKFHVPNLTTISGDSGMASVCHGANNLEEVNFSSLTSIGDNGLIQAFIGSKLRRVAFPSLTQINGNYGLYSAFSYNDYLEEIDLSNLTSTSGVGALNYLCQGDQNLRTVKLNKFSTTTDGENLYSAFDGCTSLEVVDFSEATAVPSLCATTTFDNTNNTYKILVPNALYSQWIAAPFWSSASIRPHIEKAVKALEIKARQANSTVSMRASGNVPVSLEYSTDGTTWQPFVVGTTTITLANVGDFVLMRAGENGNERLGRDYSNYNQFVITGQIEANDDVGFLLSRNGTSSTALPPYCFVKLFSGCTGLTKAPDLPSTNLGAHCYEEMFDTCTGLTTAPALPATTLAEGCYRTMFSRTGITNINLPATTLAQQCYEYMFDTCTSLSKISLGWTGDFSGANVPTNAFSNWVYGVTSSGTIYYWGSDTTQGVSAIPSGWTVGTVNYIDYIKTNGAMLDTGHVPTVNTRMEFAVRGDSHGDCFVGGDTNDGYDYRFFNAGNTAYFDLGSDRISTDDESDLWNQSTWYECQTDNYSFSFTPRGGGTTVTRQGTTHSSVDWEQNSIHVSSSWNSSNIDFDIIYLKIYEGQTLVMDLRAARYGNVICFFDEVSHDYVYPTGTYLEGTF